MNAARTRVALWHVSPGTIPQLDEAVRRVEFLERNGSTPYAFGFGRTPDPLDGRVAWLQITPAGRRVLAQVRKRHTAYLARRMRRLTPDELEILEQATHILDRLNEEDER